MTYNFSQLKSSVKPKCGLCAFFRLLEKGNVYLRKENTGFFCIKKGQCINSPDSKACNFFIEKKNV